MIFTRRWVLGALLAGTAVPALAEAPTTSIRPVPRGGVPRPPVVSAEDLVRRAALGGSVGFAVADAAGLLLESQGAETALPPASTAKAITALYALERLGPAHRFTTRLLATGPLQDGIVQGDLVLAGSGDPTLSTDALGDMAARLKAAGVRGVTGRYLAFAGALPAVASIDPEQPDHVGYNPAICGLNLNFNRVHFEWKRGAQGYSVSMDARAERFVPPVTMARMQVVTRDLPVYTYAADQGSDSWTVASTALGKGGSRWLPVRHPDAYAAEVFQTLAKAQGIDLPAAQTVQVLPEGRMLVESQSDEMRVILRDMLKFSTNITAEVVGLTASGAASLDLSGQAMAEWAAARFGIAARFRDHSGLGGASRISAAEMVSVLARADAAGTGLRGILKTVTLGEKAAAAVTVQAKTGTLNFVSALVGYAKAPSGRDLVFAILCADPERRELLPLAERERPSGGPEWTRRARTLQTKLIERWAAVYG